MSETNDTAARSGGAGKTLSLKKTETSTVKQSFSHGRSKAVVVEKKRARVAPPAKEAEGAEVRPKASPGEPVATKSESVTRAPMRETSPPRAGVVLRQLTDEEKEARSRALSDARLMEAEARKRADEEARHRAVEDAVARERAAAEKRKAEEDARKAAEEAVKRHAEEEAHRRLDKKEEAHTQTATAAPVAPGVKRARPRRGRRRGAGERQETGQGRAQTTRSGAQRDDTRRRGKLTITKALQADDERQRSVAAYRRHLQRFNRAGQQMPAPWQVRAKSLFPKRSRWRNSPTVWRAAPST